MKYYLVLILLSSLQVSAETDDDTKVVIIASLEGTEIDGQFVNTIKIEITNDVLNFYICNPDQEGMGTIKRRGKVIQRTKTMFRLTKCQPWITSTFDEDDLKELIKQEKRKFRKERRMKRLPYILGGAVGTTAVSPMLLIGGGVGLMGAANSPLFLLFAPVGLILGGIVAIATAPEIIPAFLLVGTFVATGTIIAQEIVHRIKNKDMDRMEMIRPKLHYRRLKRETVNRLKSSFDVLKKNLQSYDRKNGSYLYPGTHFNRRANSRLVL